MIPRKESLVPPGRWHLPLLALFALIVALNIPTYHSSGRFDPYHEGESMGPAISYLQGQVPYRDFLFFHGFFQDPGRSVLAFKLFGRSIGAVRSLASLFKLGTWFFLVAFIYLLFNRRFLPSLGALLFLSLIYVTFIFNVYWLSFSPAAGGAASEYLRVEQIFDPLNWLLLPSREISVFCFLLGLVLLAEGLRGPGRTWVVPAFLTAFLASATFAYSVDRAFFILLVFLVLVPFVYRRVKAEDRRLFLSLSLSGFAAGILPLAFAIGWHFEPFFDFVFIELPALKAATRLPWQWGEWHLAVFELLILFNLAGYIHLVWKGRWKIAQNFLVETALLLLSVLSLLRYLQRADLEHLIYGAAPAYLLAIRILWLETLGWKGWMRLRIPLLALAVLTAGLGAWRIHWNSLMDKNFPFTVPDSAYIPAEDARAIAYLRSLLGPGDSFFTFTSDAVWYYYLDIPCPTRFPYIWTAEPAKYQLEAVESLEKKRVKVVLYSDEKWSAYIDGIENRKRFPVINRYLLEKYRPLKKAWGKEIWIRK